MKTPELKPQRNGRVRSSEIISWRTLRGKALIKYRHTLLATIRAAEGEMEHASMRLGWGRKWRAKAKADLLKAGRKRGVALQQHWVTIGRL